MKIIRRAAIGLLALAFTAGQSLASEIKVVSPFIQKGGISDAKKAETKAEGIRVVLIVDIPGSRLHWRHHLSLIEGATVVDAARAAYPVKQGLVCCDSRDIWSVNGLAIDPYKNKWWIIKRNGNSQNTSSMTPLWDKDIVELIYKEESDPVHVRLEDWILKSDGK